MSYSKSHLACYVVSARHCLRKGRVADAREYFLPRIKKADKRLGFLWGQIVALTEGKPLKNGTRVRAVHVREGGVYVARINGDVTNVRITGKAGKGWTYVRLDTGYSGTLRTTKRLMYEDYVSREVSNLFGRKR